MNRVSRGRKRVGLAVLVGMTTLALPPSWAWAEPPAAALVGEIAFHADSPASRVMIDLAPDGNEPFVMMLDTGAAGTVVTPRFARALGVNVRRTKDTRYRKKTRLGRDLLFWVDTSSSDTAARGWEYGLLGADFLDDYVLEIDYPGRVVRFYDPDEYAIPEEATQPGEAVLPFRRSGTRVLADVEIDGKEVLMLVDTGAPAVLLAGREAKKLGIQWDGLPELEGITGVLGPIKAYTYEVKRLRFGGIAFDDQPITVAPRGAYNQGGPTDSAIGYDILGQLVLRIDYDRKRLWMRRGPQSTATYWGARWMEAVAEDVASGPSPEEVAENDARVAAEWEEQRATRRYVETSSGGFAVVDGWRLREGPKEGEVWLSHEEMLARKKERASGSGDTP